jgi:DNA-binding transcriptional LysR family regulator
VRLATTETLATRFLAPHLERFHRRHPGLTLEILCSLRTVELARREADVALRLTRPREPDVVARPLTTIDLGLYAARRYLDARPLAPRQPPSLAGHAAILFSATPAFAIENQWLQPLLAGAQVVLRADSVSAIYAACVGGVGIALLPRRVADTDPTLVPIGSAGAPEPRTVWQGVHRDLMKNARVRAVTSFLAEVVARAVDEGSERRTPA